MKVAVVGTGIAGMVAARELQRAGCDLTVFESEPRIGGHTHTVDVELGGRRVAIDTGFIVFNQRTYPNFVRLLRELGVGWKDSSMSFSATDARSGLEYNGSSLSGLFAQRLNLLRPSFWSLIRGLLRFYREAPALLDDPSDERTLGEFLEQGRYPRAFVERHLVPLAAAVWSAGDTDIRRFPLRPFVTFFANHGFLQVDGRPQWLVVEGGSRTYAEALCAAFADRIRLATPVLGVRRRAGGVELETRAGIERFERVVLATHADISLRLLRDAAPLERELLSAFPYARNEVVLHTDARVMPRCRRAWASWNAYVPTAGGERVTVSYWMNELQGLRDVPDVFVTLNRNDAIAPERVLRRLVYHHPIFTQASFRAQARQAEIDGRGGVHYCGAYWGYGFHEDGVKSALAVVPRALAREVAL